jgi:trehalose synthase
MERLLRAAERVQGAKVLELNATAVGGGVAEMLISAVPFLNSLGIDAEWKVIAGTPENYSSTKGIHNILQGKAKRFTPAMERVYTDNLEACAANILIDYDPDIITVHDPQPLCLTHYILKDNSAWLWRCHIDIEDISLKNNPRLAGLIGDCIEHYDAAIFSAAHYVVSHWPMPKFIIPPFIDPLSDKNRDLTEEEISRVLEKYHIDPGIPIIAHIGRFDPWKGLDRTIATYREVRTERKCQLVLAGGAASDDPEGAEVLDGIRGAVKNDKDVHVLDLPPTSHREINALQRAASVIMQPSRREGFGLVITEAMWKGKPVIASDVGAIPLQIRDGYTGYFYRTRKRSAEIVKYLLDKPDSAHLIGARARDYVKEHFLMSDRIADYLMAIDMTLSSVRNRNIPLDSIVSFHPWFKPTRRPRVPRRLR